MAIKIEMRKSATLRILHFRASSTIKGPDCDKKLEVEIATRMEKKHRQKEDLLFVSH